MTFYYYVPFVQLLFAIFEKGSFFDVWPKLAICNSMGENRKEGGGP